MDISDFIKSGIGAIIGFCLAQLVNLAKLWWDRYWGPRLEIEADLPNCRYMSHSVQVGSGEFLSEDVFAFRVRNVGRGVATGVRFQLLKIETRDSPTSEFSVVSNHSFPLATFNTSRDPRGDAETVLIPKAAALVALAQWREGYDAVFPSVAEPPEYYEEVCRDAVEYRFTICRFR